VRNTFESASQLVGRTLTAQSRQQILIDLAKAKTLPEALARLRDSMRSHTFRLGTERLDLGPTIRMLDSKTREDGFHILQDWDGKAEKLNEEIIPVDVLNFLLSRTERCRIGDSGREVLAILLEYYFIYVLALLALRAWDHGSPSDNFERLNQLLNTLKEPGGSGQKFAANVETLILIATSHFEPDIKAFERLLAKVRTLFDAQRLNISLAHAAILGSHLRHGFQDLYNKDLVLMRDDNEPDYPWLCFSLVTLIRAYARLRDQGIHGEERERIVEALLNGLSPDPRAFVRKSPPVLAASEAEHSEFVELFSRYRDDLFTEFGRHRPSQETYSPLSFNFNFPHNLLKGVVISALLRGKHWDLNVNDLLTGNPPGDRKNDSKILLAQTLMGYARSSPDRIRGRAVPVITYDPSSGLRSFVKTLTIVDEAFHIRSSRSNQT